MHLNTEIHLLWMRPEKREQYIKSTNFPNGYPYAGVICAECGNCGKQVVTTRERFDKRLVWHYCDKVKKEK